MRGPSRRTLVGRDAERQRLAELVAAARSGQPAFVLVEGEAGIGKSALIADAVDAYATEPDVVMVGHAVDLAGGELPFVVITSALRDLIQRQGLDAVRSVAGRGCEPLSSLVPELQEGTTPSPDRIRIVDAFVTLLTRLSADRFTIFVVEDLHWIDTGSSDVLDYLVRVLESPSNLLITASLRTQEANASPELGSRLNELVRSPVVQRLTLSRLGRSDIAAQLENLLEAEPSGKLLDRVAHLSDGVPFIAEELVAGGLAADGPVPPSVQGLMLSRVGRLPPVARQVIEAASIGPHRLRHAALAQVTGLADTELEAAVKEAIQNVVLEVEGSDCYRFHHALMREAVDGSLLPADRLRWHRRWAECLEDDHSRAIPLDLIEAAHHWAHTDDVERAFESATRAAKLASELGALSEEAAHLTRVLEMWPRLPESVREVHDRGDFLDDALHAYMETDQIPEAVGLIDRELARSGNYADDLRDQYLRFLKALISSGAPHREQHERAVAERAAMLQLLQAAPPTRLYVRAAAQLPYKFVGGESAAVEEEVLARAVEAADALGRPRDRLQIRHSQILQLQNLGRPDQAALLCMELLPWVRRGFPLVEVCEWESRASVWVSALGRPKEGADLARKSIARLGDNRLAPWTFIHGVEHLAYALIELGEWDEAEANLDEAFRVAPRGANRIALDARAGWLQCLRGDIDRARDCLRRGRDAIEQPIPPMLRDRFVVAWLEASMAAAVGGHADVRRILTPLLEAPAYRVLQLFWRVIVTLVRAESDAALAMPSRRREKPVSGSATERMDELSNLVDSLHVDDGLMAACKAYVAAERSRIEGMSDPMAWQEAAEAWAKPGYVHDHAWAMVRLAECRIATGDKTGAQESLLEALTIADRLRAKPLLDQARDVARRGRIDLGRDRDTATPRAHRDFGLTQRELEVLALIVDGNSNEQIAHRLFISPKTASVHVSRILAKLGVPSRSAATSLALREGLLDDNAPT